MKCYYAPSEDAIGVCKCCGRGLSHEFAVDLGKGLACKGRCEEDVKALIGFVERNIAASVRADEILRRSAGTSIWSSVFSVITGSFFVGFGIYNGVETFTTGMGAIFVIYGIASLLRSRRFSQLVKR